jgi:hypothetical protein
MPPQVINQQSGQIFKFWRNGVYTGMRYGHELYACYRTYPIEGRLKAYDLACGLFDEGIQTCVTCSSFHYIVWITLRAPLPLSSPGHSSSAL